MRIINIVEVLNGSISQILSFPIHEDQLSEEVVSQAEDTFKKTINEVTGIDVEDLDSVVEDGYYTDDNGWELSLVWSEIN